MNRSVGIHTGVAAALVMLFGFTGCDSFLEPSSIADTYVLESVGGMSLPVVVSDTEPVRAQIVADTFRLQPSGTGNRVYTLDVQYAYEPQRDGRTVIERRISYQLKGEAIEITDVCGPAELCAPPPHWTGRVTSDELRLNGAPGPYVYRRAER